MSPTIALLWEIWCQRRWMIVTIGALTAAGRVLRNFDPSGRDRSPLTDICGMLAFLLLIAVFNYTDSSGDRGIGRFPRRLFTLPVSSLRLVIVPMGAAISAIELLYLLWMTPLSRGGPASATFIAVLLGAFMVIYLAALWTLERTGLLRIIIIGLAASALFAIAMVPLSEPSSVWESESVLTVLVAAAALISFLLAWRHIARVRAGGFASVPPLAAIAGVVNRSAPKQQRPFHSAASAHMWFEWRSSGIVLPALVSGMLLIATLPGSLMLTANADQTFALILATLALPILLSIPLGFAFSRPTFWADDLAVPSFIAVRPISSEELIATKIKVAALSAALSWAIVIAFLLVWLNGWANVDALSMLAIQLWVLHGQSVAAVAGIAALVVIAGMFLTWRFLICRLWNGLSGRRAVFLGSGVMIAVIAVTALVFDAQRWPGRLLHDQTWLARGVLIASVVVMIKYWLAAYTWRSITTRYARRYMVLWAAGTACFITLGLVVWGVMRNYVATDAERSRSLIILVALLTMPLARLGLARSALERNRHRR